MGAMPWEGMGPWREDPTESLRALQAEYFTAHYDLLSFIQKRLDGVREAIRLTEADGDPHDILSSYKQDLAVLERASREPLPAAAEGRIALLRRIEESSGQGLGNVLDVVSVSGEGDVFVARILAESDLRELFSTTKPNREMAATTMDKVASHLGRGESVCLPVFDQNGMPEGWWFAGYSID